MKGLSGIFSLLATIVGIAVGILVLYLVIKFWVGVYNYYVNGAKFYRRAIEYLDDLNRPVNIPNNIPVNNPTQMVSSINSIDNSNVNNTNNINI